MVNLTLFVCSARFSEAMQETGYMTVHENAHGAAATA
jgi:hypothetical protein